MDKRNFSAFSEQFKLNNHFQESKARVNFGNENLFLYKKLSSKIMFEEVYLDKKYLIKDSIPYIKWELLNEKKYFNEFELFKATSYIEKDSTQLIAWYCPKISISDGPLKYSGLPGLILELEIKFLQKKDPDILNSIKFIVQKITYNDKEIDKIKFPKKIKILTRKEFQNLEIEFSDKELEMLTQGVEKE